MAKICSYNVKGLGNKQKRNTIFQWIKDHKIDICLVQEAHYSETSKQTWKKDWGGEAYFSGNSSKSAGVGILLADNLNITVNNMTEILEGRILALDIVLNETEITLINIYGPNNDDPTFFQKLESFCAEKEENNFIIGGDFNLVMDPDVDKSGGIKNTHNRSRLKLNDLVDKYDLIDVWRAFNPDKKRYTWHSNTKPKIYCRLDYFLMKSNLMNCVEHTEIKASIKSDHSTVSINLDTNNIKRGPGIFKLNNSLLLEEEYVTKIKKSN